MTECKSIYKYAKMSASKVRLVINQIRGKPVTDAQKILNFSDKRAAVMIRKTLKAAVAGAEEKGLDKRQLYVSRCWADEGPTRRTWLPRARGSATPLLHRSSHITVYVGQKESSH